MKKTSPLFLLLLPLIVAGMVVWIPLYVTWRFGSGIILRAWFRKRHVSRGRTILFVYSNSPNWQQYVEANLLPLLGNRALVLNWSERRNWSRWEGGFFDRFAGSREFNPVALVYRPYGGVEVIRFHQAFLDFKHGNDALLRAAEAELTLALAPR